MNKNTVYTNGWTRGAYQCLCKTGFYSARHPNGFNGTIMEVAYQEYRDNISTYYVDDFRCFRCAEGCAHCTSSAPCLASYNWIFRISILIISVLCAGFTIFMACYMYRHRKVKVFKVASPIFLTITLLGCAIMYMEVSYQDDHANFFFRHTLNHCCFRTWSRLFQSFDHYGLFAVY